MLAFSHLNPSPVALGETKRFFEVTNCSKTSRLITVTYVCNLSSDNSYICNLFFDNSYICNLFSDNSYICNLSF
jgi:hypothetical protein